MTENAENNAEGYGDLIAELHELADVPTEVLGSWVTERGRCLWETTIDQAPQWLDDAGSDRELAARLCAGCPVRFECLAFELRTDDGESIGVWGGLNEADRDTLRDMWSRCRDQSDVDVSTVVPASERRGGERA